MRTPVLILLSFLALSPAPAVAQRGDAAPTSGADVLARMRAAYDGKWYHTLTFTQNTVFHDTSGKTTNQTWYETLRHTPQHGTQLRIDVGAPSAGRGVLYTADSMWVFREGKLVAQRADGNVFLPLIEGVYVQPVERTVKELAPVKVDMGKVYTRQWQGRPVWVVGAAGAADTTSPQFWVEVERKVVVRAIVGLVPNEPPTEIRLDGYVPAGKGWLATKIVMSSGGKVRQTEEYSAWKTDVTINPELFDPTRWTTARHWAQAADSSAR